MARGDQDKNLRSKPGLLLEQMTKKIKRIFTPQEDFELARLINEHGVDDWGFIARNMPNEFTARQCRERWKNYLDPRLHHCPWTDEEDRRLMREFNRVGPKWIPLSRMFPGRSGNAIRNRVFVLRRKKECDPKDRSLPIPIIRTPLPRADSRSNAPLQSLLSLCDDNDLCAADSEAWIQMVYSGD
jgi:hypothetical protein